MVIASVCVFAYTRKNCDAVPWDKTALKLCARTSNNNGIYDIVPVCVRECCRIESEELRVKTIISVSERQQEIGRD